MATRLDEILQTSENEWITFPGGELEGTRPNRLCAACRERLHHAARSRLEPKAAAERRSPICFQCYREELEREKALRAAGDLNTGTEQRFQFALPLEPVNHSRLAALKAARAAVRVQSSFVDRRRQAQIAARYALEAIGTGLRRHHAAACDDRPFMDAVHAAELQLPESWLPFVVAR